MRLAHFSNSIAALTLLLSALAPTAQAECECLWEGSFADVEASTDLVLAATVQRIKGNSMDLLIEETLRGKVYLDTVRVWLKTADYCRPEVDEFPVNSRWVFALNKIREVPDDGFDPLTPNISYGRPDDYYLSECGGYWLTYEGEAVTGNLVDAPRWARDPDMTPVLMSVIRSYVNGDTSKEALKAATEEDPALDNLMLDTKAFLRGDPDS